MERSRGLPENLRNSESSGRQESRTAVDGKTRQTTNMNETTMIYREGTPQDPWHSSRPESTTPVTFGKCKNKGIIGQKSCNSEAKHVFA